MLFRSTRTALALIPDGRRVPLSRDPGTAWSRTTLAELLDLLAAGKLKPLVADRIPLAEASRAHELLGRGGHAGKIVLIPNP